MKEDIFDFKISYLETVGMIYNGIGIIMIIKYEDIPYESLFWVSPVEEVKDKLIMPLSFLNKKNIEKISEYHLNDDMIKEVWRVLPVSRENILKEFNK